MHDRLRVRGEMKGTDQQPAILLTGATGCIGGRLLAALEAGGREVRCMTRRPDALTGKVGPNSSVVRGDCLKPDSLQGAFAGIDTAYYMVHSMGGSADFEARDREAAQNFGAAARAAGVRRIVYVGGLGSASGLSRHLRSRHETGEVLRASGVPVIEFRSGIVLGAGSLSFELIRALVERLPVMVCPSWVRTPTQPIALADLVAYLAAALDLPHGESRLFEVGGADVVSYREIMREYARWRGLRRLLIPVPLLTPRLSSLWLGLTTPVYAKVGRQLVDGLRTATVVNDAAAKNAFPIQPLGLRDAIAKAAVEEDAAYAATPWSEATLAPATPLRWGGVRIRGRLIHSTVRRSPGPARRRIRPNPAHRRRGRLVLRRLDVALARSGRSVVGRGRNEPRQARRGASCRGRGPGLLAGRGLRTGRPPAPQGGNEAAGPRLARVRRHAPGGRGIQGAPDRRLRCGRPVGTILLARPVSDSRPAVRGASSEHRQTRGPGDVPRPDPG